MKRLMNLLAVSTLVLLLTASFTFAQQKKAQNKGVKKSATTTTVQTKGANWVDANGDGICDNVGTAKQGKSAVGRGFGKKDGTGNPLKPQDGTGFGAKKGGKLGKGNGTCDGTGPKGSKGRKGRRGNK